MRKMISLVAAALVSVAAIVNAGNSAVTGAVVSAGVSSGVVTGVGSNAVTGAGNGAKVKTSAETVKENEKVARDVNVVASSENVKAGANDLVWDFTEKAPGNSPVAADNNNSVKLSYGSKVNDGEAGSNNGLNGIKLNSSGYCYFTKSPVSGLLRLSFGPRSGQNKASLEVFTWEGDQPAGTTSIAKTDELSEYGSVLVKLSADQNNIYIKRLLNTETVLQKIEFREGDEWGQAECEIVFKDQNGDVLGKVQTLEKTLLAEIPYTVDDLPAIGEGNAFRGWFYINNKKAQVGDSVLGNTTIQAKVTPIEVATVGSVWTYNLSSETFYAEDHELITISGEDITVRLAGKKAVVRVVPKNGSEQELRYDGETSVTLEGVEAGKVKSIVIYNVLDYLAKDEKTGYYIVPANDVASFLLALEQVQEGDNIFLPNGVYDLGETVLTSISKNNVSLIGQSMEGVVIKNAPDAQTESIDRTATLRIAKGVRGTYIQDLTIQNALDYYKNDNGRAVALWDLGTQTVCKNVRLLSYQDTYYSNLQGAVKYFRDCEIHGTVDFICGDGSVYFKNCLLYAEKRKKNGGGSDALTANNGVATDRGYVFESCTVKSECPVVSMGRAWNNKPSVAFLNTTVDYSAGKFDFADDDNKIQRWTKELMNANAWPSFGEYNTRQTDGALLTPGSNVVKFLDTKSGNVTKDIETVLSAEQAAVYTMEYTLGNWTQTALDDARQETVETDGYEATGIYLVEVLEDGACHIMTGEELNADILVPGVSIRKANRRGGFGAVGQQKDTESVSNVQRGDVQSVKVMQDGQVYVMYNGTKYNVQGIKTNGLVK